MDHVKTLGPNIVESIWDMSNTGNGSMLAREANLLLDKIPEGDWVVYLQADELINPTIGPELRNVIANLETYSDDPYTTIELYRAYFWRDLKTIRLDWSLPIARVFKKGCAVVSQDGMPTERLSGRSFRPFDTGMNIYREPYKVPPWIYHYSRVGDPTLISNRLVTLDGLFHEQKDLPDDLPAYDFQTREYDSFSITATPGVREGSFLRYDGPHPDGIEEFYGV